MAQRLDRTPSTLSRPLAALHRAGIIRRWVDGNRIYYARDPDCPFLADLQQLLIKTIGLADVLVRTLGPYSKSIRIALVYGSVAHNEERSRSDVDVMVIGSLADLSFNARFIKGGKTIATAGECDHIVAAGFCGENQKPMPLPAYRSRRP